MSFFSSSAIIAQMKNLFAIYCHWPFCLSKCPYCDFFSLPSHDWNEQLFIKRYNEEIKQIPTSQNVTSIFFGGGTPSLMSTTLLEDILNNIYKHCHVDKDVEITIEANPDAIDLQKIKDFHRLGINRLSLGVQALNNQDLHFLGRRHSAETARKRINEILNYFDNVSIDLIYARPQQTWEQWEKELNEALSFNLPHYSLYQLTIEEKTPFAHKNISLPDDELARTLFLKTIEKMDSTGIPLYEVSNFAKPGYECQHNQTYWLGKDYVGIGPSAHGRLGLIATENPRNIQNWLKGEKNITPLSLKEKEEERILMGLRQRQGIDIQNISPQSIQRVIEKGWVIQKGDHVFPTNEGLIMLNSLILELWP